VIAVVAFALCGGPQLIAAQQTQSDSDAQSSSQGKPDAQNSDQNVGTSPESATPDPSRGPLKPNELPNAPSASQQQQQTDQQQPSEAPIGAAAAQAGKASGGAASKPAGTAIAPAKQHQTRSLLIKVGAVAAGAAALGIVYALSRGTPSVPPGANTTATTTTAATAPGGH
jgi:hypothetical protein